MIPIVMDFLPWRRVLPPAEPPLDDLEQQSKQRELAGLRAEIKVRREEVTRRALDDVADPYGPDPVVFGSVPRVGG